MSNESNESVYFDDFKVSYTRGRIIEENHYYAFGLRIAGISSVKLSDVNEGSLKNNNLYNDKELFDDADLDWYDYGFRNYDPQIGRFPQLDPLTDDYPELTNYQYASNDPILNIDLDGMEGAVSNVSKIAETAVTNSSTLLAEVKIFAVLPKAAKAGTSILSKAATAMNVVGKGIGWFANGLWNEGVVPTVDWVNHNVNPVYGVFNGINSQFTHQDFFNGTPMTHAEGITDAALPFIPFGKVGGVIEKTAFKTVEKLSVKGGTTVLGHYPEYAKLAETLGARKFQVPTSVWNKMSAAEQWTANTKFLDRMILRGDNIRLATPINQVKPGSFFQKELNYLFEKGYKVSSDGLLLVK